MLEWVRFDREGFNATPGPPPFPKSKLGRT